MFVIAILWTAFFLINFNIAMMIPLLPFVQAALGLSTTQAGWVLAAFPLTALFANLALGPWIDRLGRKRFIVIGAAGCATLFALTATATNVTTLVLARAATGLFMPMIGASVFAAIADYIQPESRVRISGYVATAAPIAFLLSMSLGMVLGGLLAWQVPLLLAATLAALLALCATRLPATPPEALAASPVTRRVYQDRLFSLSTGPETRRLFIAYVCWSSAVFVFLGLYPTWIVQHGLPGHGPASNGAMLLLGEVGGLAGALLSGRVANRRAHAGRATPLRICALAAFATAAIACAVPFGVGLQAYQALVYAGFAFGRDLMLALILGGAMALVPAAQRGSLNGILNAILQTGAMAGALAGAWLYTIRPDFFANAATAAALLILCGLNLWQIDRPTKPAPRHE